MTCVYLGLGWRLSPESRALVLHGERRVRSVLRVCSSVVSMETVRSGDSAVSTSLRRDRRLSSHRGGSQHATLMLGRPVGERPGLVQWAPSESRHTETLSETAGPVAMETREA